MLSIGIGAGEALQAAVSIYVETVGETYRILSARRAISYCLSDCSDLTWKGQKRRRHREGASREEWSSVPSCNLGSWFGLHRCILGQSSGLELIGNPEGPIRSWCSCSSAWSGTKGYSVLSCGY